MAKYRLLSPEELETLKKEFVDYLVLNGIVADDWKKMKSTEPEKAQKITELFSDVVFEKIMRTTTYLVRFERQKIFAFNCGQDDIELICLETSENSYDFTTEAGISRLKNSPPKDLNIFRASKDYSQQREVEMYKMTEAGCLVEDGAWFNSLENLMKE